MAFVGLTYSQFMLELETRQAIYIGIGIAVVVTLVLTYILDQVSKSIGSFRNALKGNRERARNNVARQSTLLCPDPSLNSRFASKLVRLALGVHLCPKQTGKFRAFWNKSSTPGHIPNKAKFFLAFPVMPVALSNTLIHNAYIKFYTDMVGLDVEYVGCSTLCSASGTRSTTHCWARSSTACGTHRNGASTPT